MTLDPNRDDSDDVIILGDGTDDDLNHGYVSANRIVITNDGVYHVDLGTGDVEEIDTTGI